MSTCLAAIEGCAICAAELAYRGDHDCGESCKLMGELRAKSENYHAWIHRPTTCANCGGVLWNRTSPPRVLFRLCASNHCMIAYCPGCKVDISTDPGDEIECPTCLPKM